MTNQLIQGDCLKIIDNIPADSVNLIYLDPPFFTGKEHTGPAGGFSDKWEGLGEYMLFIDELLGLCHYVLSPTGSIYLHCDARTSHHTRFALDRFFQEGNFVNEIIWSYDYGGRSKQRWSNKHDTIFWYAKDKNNYTFNYDAADRIPYLAPGLVGAEKAARGKTPTDVWWNTIVPTNGKERVGYPTQKPLAILNRIILTGSKEGDTILDPVCGSGTTLVAAEQNKRNYIGIDKNPDAIKIAKARLKCATISATGYEN